MINVPPSTHAVLSEPSSLDRLATPIRTARPRRGLPAALAALENRNYRFLLGSQAIGSIGGWMQRVAQDWLVLQLTGSVAAVGITVALQFIPFLIFGLFSGVLADRYPKKRILLITQSLASLCAVTLGVLALTGTVQAWHVYIIAFVLGTVMVIDNPARSAFVSELVGPARIRNAVSLNSSVFHSAALIGPALSGVLIAGVGMGWSFIANAAATALVVLVIAQIRPTAEQTTTKSATTTRRKGELREGLAYIRNTSEVRWALILLGVASLLVLNMSVVITAYADKVFHLGVHGYTLLTSLNAVGALAGALLSATRRGPQRLRDLALLLGVLGAGVAIASHVPNATAYGIMLVICGVVTLTFLIGANTLVQTTCAPQVRGRVMSVYILIQMGLQALASPVLGVSMDHIGPQNTLLVAGVATVVLAVVAAALMARQSNLSLGLHRYRRSDFHLDPIQLGRFELPFVTPTTVKRVSPVTIVPMASRRREVLARNAA